MREQTLPTAAIQILESCDDRGILRLGVHDYKEYRPISKQKLLTAEIARKPIQDRNPRACAVIMFGISLRSLVFLGVLLRLKAFGLDPVPENTRWIDDDEYRAATGEHGSLLVHNFGHAREPPPAFANLSRFDFQSLV